VSVQQRHVSDVIAALLHTVLFHRTVGEVHPRDEHIESLSLTYVRCDSEVLAKEVDQVCSEFMGALNTAAGRGGQVTANFYRLEKTGLLGKEQPVVWEKWTFDVSLLDAQADVTGTTEALQDTLHKISHAILRKKDKHIPCKRGGIIDDRIRERPYHHNFCASGAGKGKSTTLDAAKRLMQNFFSSW